MAVTTIHKPEIDESKYSLPIEQGGTGARRPESAAKNLGLVTYGQVEKKDGVALLNEENSVQVKNYPASLTDGSLPVLFGDSAFYVGQDSVVQIVNYDAGVAYVVDQTNMPNTSFTLNGDRITLRSIANIAASGVLRVNGREFPYEILLRKPATPSVANLTGQLLSDRILVSGRVPFESQSFTGSLFRDDTGTLQHAYTDWELSTELAFGTSYKSSSAVGDSLSWAVTNFDPDATYYLRLRHVSTLGSKSDWSLPYQFRTAILKVIVKPSFTSPVDQSIGVSPSPTFAVSAFQGINFQGTHTSTDWQVSTTADFNNIVYSSMGDGVNLTQWTPGTLAYNGTFYARARHRADIAASNGSPYSEWSTTVSFTVMADNRSIVTPNVDTFDGVHIGVSKTNPKFVGSAFVPVNYSDTHQFSRWQISPDLGFSNILHDSGNSASLKAYDPTVTLSDGVMYYIRLKYSGLIKVSEWSSPCYFTTAATASLLGVGPGGNGGGAAPNNGWVETTANAGGGGAGGEVSAKAITLVPKEVYTIHVGAASSVIAAPGYPGEGGDDSYVVLKGTRLFTARRGLGGAAGGLSETPAPGGVGSSSDGIAGGRGGQGGAMRADAGGATYYAYSENGGGVAPGLAGLSDLNYGTTNHGGGGGGSPSVAVAGLTFKGGDGRNQTTVDGGTGSGGGGGGYGGYSGGRGGHGGFVLEYSAAIPKVTTTGATYSLVDGKHRFVWSTPGDYTFELAVLTANIVISSDTLNFNLRDKLIADYGWDEVLPVDATVTINAGVYVGGDSSKPAVPGFKTGTVFPNGTNLSLVNNGFIVGYGGYGGSSSNYNTYAGHGGPGGNAFEAQTAISVTNNGTIGGGGGGGGGGQGGSFRAGSGGGGGQGYMGGYAGPSTGGGVPSGPGSGDGSKTSPGYAGSTQAPTVDEYGTYTYYGATGGNGGTLGNYGGSSNSWGWSGQITSGGAPGNAVTGNSFITWLNTGTRLGPIA